MPLYQCDVCPFEGDTQGAARHCGITGHTLRRTDNLGNVRTVYPAQMNREEG